jgi:Cd2+/Zn2+-exporting ATPase
MLFYQIGELLQSLAVSRSRKNITELMDIAPETANLETEGGMEETDPDDVPVGSVIIIRTGEKIPIDGVVIEGDSEINTAALTGESVPRHVREGDEVISGCVNTGAVLRVRTTKAFSDSTVSRILELVENSSFKKAKAEAFITKFARYYTPAVCIGALALAVIPSLITGDWREWIHRALTFLVISCPCALLVSIPLAFFGSIGGASRSGILIKGGTDVETLADVKTVMMDKTGTLTKGVFSVSELFPAEGVSPEELLRSAAIAETFSTHPIANALRERAGIPVDSSEVHDASEIAGQGVSVVFEGARILAGNEKLMRESGIDYIPCTKAGTIVYTARGGVFLGSVRISDSLKPTSAKAVAELRSLCIDSVMLTGDSEAAAADIAREAGIADHRSGLLPEDKVRLVEEAIGRSSSGAVAFVGDGINDAPVLMRSDVGIAMGSLGSDAAIEAADVVLMDDEMLKIPAAIKLARKCMRVVKENIAFALGVKFLCLILGALGLAGMWPAIFADVGVMVLSVLNSARMLKKV